MAYSQKALLHQNEDVHQKTYVIHAAVINLVDQFFIAMLFSQRLGVVTRIC